MVHGFIGLVVGIIMGLTGAGGALISIPLFISLLQTPLKDATVLSLVAVMLGTSVNLMGAFRKIDYRTFLAFTFFGILSNLASLRLKAMVPDSVIVGLLTLIASYSVWSMWKKKNSPPVSEVKPGLMKVTVTGLALGLMTTLTGLGGGVVLVPILMTFFGKTYGEALPTSLATIFSISLVAFLLQTGQGSSLITGVEILYLGAGSLTSFLMLKTILSRVSPGKVDQTRRIVFSMVTFYSIINVLIKTV